MASNTSSLGIIAGSRSLPIELARAARQHGVMRLAAVGFEGETDPNLAQWVDDLVWLRVGQLDRMIQCFKERGIHQCVMAGQIAPKNLFDLRPDVRALKLLWRLKERNAQTLFAAIGEELAKEGVALVEATPWIKSLMPDQGFRLGRRLSEEEAEDVAFGFRIAKEISRLEIGQTVVVKHGTVLAVEGFEGTDRCLQRGGELAGKSRGAVAVKVAKENHDMRFDLPCVGLSTVETCAGAGVGVLAIEANKSVLLERPQVEECVVRHKLALVSVS